MRGKIILLTLLCGVLLAACGPGGADDTPASAQEPEPQSQSEPQSAPEPEHTAPSTGEPTVLSEILGAVPEEVTAFTYFDTPKLLYRDDGAVFPEEGFSAITYECGQGYTYKEEQNAFTAQLAQALEDLRVEGQSQVADGQGDLPTGRYYTIWPVLASDWQPVLTFFDSGEIYMDANGGGDEIHRRWQMSDPAQFDELQALLEEIGAGLYALPLDYHLSMGLRHNLFQPASEALRIWFNNEGAAVVTAQSLTVERKTDSGWEKMADIPTPDLAVAAYRSYTDYAIDLTAIDGGQQPGEYRVKGELLGDGQTLPMELEYAISAQATDLSNPPLPKMTPENQEYCERYVHVWGFYSPFEDDFDEAGYIKNFHTYHLYSAMAYAEGVREEHNKAYGIDIPAAVVEGTILRHFLFTEAQIRANTTKARNDTEYYNPDTDTYHFAGGYGGVGYSAVVSDSRREGDELTLVCDWYDYDDNFRFSQELTVRLGQGENDFLYIAGRMLRDQREA